MKGFFAAVNTVLVTTYFGLQIWDHFKDNAPEEVKTKMTLSEEKLKAALLEKMGPEFVERLMQVRDALKELRQAPVSLMEAAHWLAERKQIDPLLKTE